MGVSETECKVSAVAHWVGVSTLSRPPPLKFSLTVLFLPGGCEDTTVLGCEALNRPTGCSSTKEGAETCGPASKAGSPHQPPRAAKS